MPHSADSLSGITYWRSAARMTATSLRATFERRSIPANISAGITVTLVALPLNLALAIAGGLPPSVGLVTGAVAGVIGSLLGGARLQVTGPEVALAPITLEIVLRHGYQGLVVATFLAGALQILFGIVRAGRVVHAIPVPVVGGFLAAVGLLVFDSQIPRLLGLSTDVVLATEIRPAMLADVDISAPLLGFIVVAVVVVLPRLNRSIPAHLVGLLVAVGSVAFFGLGGPTVAPITSAIPSFGWPSFANVDLPAVLPEALALALVASIDSLLCAVSVDGMVGGEKTRTDQELAAQGLANIGSSLVGGMPVAAAVVRSVTAVQAGATTRLAPLVQSVLLGLILLVLAPFVSLIPLASLSAILLVVGFRLIDFRRLSVMWRLARFEAGIFVVTAAGILVTDFVFGVVIGIVAALAHFAHQQRAELRARSVLDVRRGLDRVSAGIEGDEDVKTAVVRIEGPLFFGSQSEIEAAIGDVASTKRVIVDVSAVSTVDVSGALALGAVLRQLVSEGARVWVGPIGSSAAPALVWMIEHCREDGMHVVERLLPPDPRLVGGGAHLPDGPLGVELSRASAEGS